jgi:hypothetical protein
MKKKAADRAGWLRPPVDKEGFGYFFPLVSPALAKKKEACIAGSF